MALSQQHRSSLYATLSPVVGAEEAEALLREFPSNDLEVPATKDFVRAEVADVRAEVAGLRAEMSDRFHQQTVWLVGTGLSLASLLLGCTAFLTLRLG